VTTSAGNGHRDVRYYRTVKTGEGVTRTELEEETTETVFETMWPLTRGHRLRKRRFAVDVDGRTWEIDEFRNRDLVLAEIELGSEDEDVVFPDWLAPAVQREVTTEPEFQNINLAR
jgi:CYTH domain-containing protein